VARGPGADLRPARHHPARPAPRPGHPVYPAPAGVRLDGLPPWRGLHPCPVFPRPGGVPGRRPRAQGSGQIPHSGRPGRRRAEGHPGHPARVPAHLLGHPHRRDRPVHAGHHRQPGLGAAPPDRKTLRRRRLDQDRRSGGPGHGNHLALHQGPDPGRQRGPPAQHRRGQGPPAQLQSPGTDRVADRACARAHGRVAGHGQVGHPHGPVPGRGRAPGARAPGPPDRDQPGPSRLHRPLRRQPPQCRPDRLRRRALGHLVPVPRTRHRHSRTRPPPVQGP